MHWVFAKLMIQYDSMQLGWRLI